MASSIPRRLVNPLSSVVNIAVARVAHWGPVCQDARGVARVRINRFTGVKAVKVSAPKTEWQIAAEKEFLAMRENYPKDEYLPYLTADDVHNLSPQMRRCLTLRCGSAEDVSGGGNSSGSESSNVGRSTPTVQQCG